MCQIVDMEFTQESTIYALMNNFMMPPPKP